MVVMASARTMILVRVEHVLVPKLFHVPDVDIVEWLSNVWNGIKPKDSKAQDVADGGCKYSVLMEWAACGNEDHHMYSTGGEWIARNAMFACGSVAIFFGHVGVDGRLAMDKD